MLILKMIEHAPSLCGSGLSARAGEERLFYTLTPRRGKINASPPFRQLYAVHGAAGVPVLRIPEPQKLSRFLPRAGVCQNGPVTSSAPSKRPVMVFDGDCGFCRIWIARWQRGNAGIDYVPYQEAAAWFPGISRDAFARAVHLIEPDGLVSRGACAVFRALALGRPRRRLPLWLYQHVPGVAASTEAAYRLVAGRRQFFSGLTRLLWGSNPEPPTFFLTRWLFIKGLALIYLIAFLSLLVQADGLMGPNGILPAADYLQAAHAQLGADAYRVLPTLAWLHPGGATPVILCALGVTLSLVLLAGLAPAPLLAGLWALYLSVTVIGQDFLSFQWDGLLLETGFLAILLAPGGLRPGLGLAWPPARASLFLLRWTLFRLMFMSGAVKLLSGDPRWWNLSALTVYYETQPLPHALSWFAHQLPARIQTLSCVMMFIIELAVPFLIWMPRRPRQVAFTAFALFQSLIILTGNYGFFNLLALLLALILLDDAVLRRVVPDRLGWRLGAHAHRIPRLRQGLITLVVMALFAVGLMKMSDRLLRPAPLPAAARQALAWTGPFRTINNYGLFAVMTPHRPEIQIEGSRDGRTWEAYTFRFKPGDPHVRPRLAAAYMPRLDWQMWFAALGDARRTPWFARLQQALLEGRPEVLRLMAHNPFPDRPPRYVRAVLYRYHFTRAGEEGWWRREAQGLYAPPVSLRR
ncbi:MAG: DUF393 domain-containing protein [Acidobacteria bacterium]|nr:MAG: DUF393 domain-containing protein [Acidobacteriota bacterium]